MSHLSQQDRDAIRKALEAERRNLLDALRAAQADSGETQFAAVLGRGSGDSSDEALAVTLGDLAASRMDHEVRAINALNAAAARLDDESLGVCEDCDAQIPLARLLINPTATRCVACQELHEHSHASASHASL